MRILMVTDVYFPRVNGVSTSIQTFRETLQQLGHEVVLIAPQYVTDTDNEAGIHRVASGNIPFDPEDRLIRKKQTEACIARLHEQHNFDLIHIQTPFIAHYAGVKMAKKLGLPVIETYHTYFEEYMHNYVPLFPKWILKSLVRGFTRRQCNDVSALIVPSTAMQQVLGDYGVTTKTKVIPTGINISLFAKGNGQSFRLKHGIDQDQPVVVHLGRLGHEKNIDFLFHVFKQVHTKNPQAIFIVAGEGPALAHLQVLAQKLGVAGNVRFVGYLERKTELLDCYCAGNAFIFSSRTETQGLVLLEALALGVPVVSTAYLGTRDVLWKQQGAIIAEEDVQQFSQQLDRVLADPGLQARMSKQGREYAKQWSHEAIAGTMVDFYTGVITDYYAAGNTSCPETEVSTNGQAQSEV